MASSNTYFVGLPADNIKCLRSPIVLTPNGTSSMAESAVARTPVEIWQRILEMAICVGPPFPIVEDGFVENLSVFDDECTIMATHHASELARNRLRLVCKSWDAFLNQTTHSFVPIPSYSRTTVPSDEALRTANRIQMIYHPFVCVCHERCYLSHRWIMAHRGRLSRGYGRYCGLGDIIEQCGELNAQVLRCDIARSDLASVGSAFPCLKVLSTHPGRGNWSIKLSQHFPLLTHLDIDGNVRDAFRSGLDLPNLITFSIRLLNHDASAYGQDWTTPEIWNLPSLSYLFVEGYFGRAFIRTHLDTLLRSCGPTLQGLAIVQANRRDVTVSGFTFPDNLWELCPNLVTLGGTAQSLLYAPRPPAHINLQTIVLTSLFGPAAFETKSVVRETPESVAAGAGWTFDHFGLRMSWERFWLNLQTISIHERAEWINFLVQFGLFTRRHGRPLKDANGVAFDDPAAEHIRQSIQMETAILAGRLKTTSWTDQLSQRN